GIATESGLGCEGFRDEQDLGHPPLALRTSCGLEWKARWPVAANVEESGQRIGPAAIVINIDVMDFGLSTSTFAVPNAWLVCRIILNKLHLSHSCRRIAL